MKDLLALAYVHLAAVGLGSICGLVLIPFIVAPPKQAPSVLDRKGVVEVSAANDDAAIMQDEARQAESTVDTTPADIATAISDEAALAVVSLENNAAASLVAGKDFPVRAGYPGAKPEAPSRETEHARGFSYPAPAPPPAPVTVRAAAPGRAYYQRRRAAILPWRR